MDLELVEQQFGQIALAEALAAARTYAERSLSDSTRRSYARDLSAFQAWCLTRGVSTLPAEPQTLAAYLADLAQTDRPATIGRKLAAIAVAHRDAGLESPTEHGMVKRTLAGIRREKGTAPHQKSALLVDDLRRIVAPLGTSLLDCRDRALLLLGFAAALRRGELVALRVEDVTVRRRRARPYLAPLEDEPRRAPRDDRGGVRQRADDVPRASRAGLARCSWARRGSAVRRADAARRVASDGAGRSDGRAHRETALQGRGNRSIRGRRPQPAARLCNGRRSREEAGSHD